MVYASDEFYLNVRSQAVEYLRNHWQGFEGFITNDYASMDNYITLMSRDDHWADNAIIRATSDALNIEIHVISSAEDAPTITFRSTTNNSSQTIFLGHIAHSHYRIFSNLVRPKK